jgi:hypothetical protein
MLTGDPSVLSALFATSLLSWGEACQLRALQDNLPAGWMLEVKAEAGMAWAAFVFCMEHPRSQPVFTLCRWYDRMGLFVQWMDGTASSAAAFTDLEPILDLIPNGIFASAEARLVTVSTEGWANTQH